MRDLIGRYQVQEKIGEGAMADVYRAYDPSIRRSLAIKLLKEQFSADEEYASRFLREAKAAGALSHPNIVTIFDVGEIDGHPYIVMELLDGEPLNEVMKKIGKMPAPQVLSIASQLAAALSYAHGLGVVHRDIKPSNIMLGSDGETLKILDFGIARLEETGVALEDDQLKTRIGQVLGTPRYMSPEQALGQEIDGRSDLFSVGVVMYELISGRKAFGGSSAATLALQITQEDPDPIAKHAPETPRGLQFIVTKLLSKKPERRFADGRALLNALRRERASQDAAEAEAEAKNYLPLPVKVTAIVAGITALVLLLTVGAVVIRQDQVMRRLAITSGEAMTGFVASNVALKVADNATLPPERQDWLPVQAFISAAATDKDLLDLEIANAAGVVRSASNPQRLNKPLAPVEGEGAVESGRADILVRRTGASAGFRFVAPVVYAGRRSGTVSLTLSSADLRNAATLAHAMMVMLAGVVLIGVVAATYIVLRAFDRPLLRLRQALEEAAGGSLDFRLSHNRTDEFGQLFDAFNRLCSNLQERFDNLEAMALEAGARAQDRVHERVQERAEPETPERKTSLAAASDPALSAPDPETSPAPPNPADPLEASSTSEGAVTPFRRPPRRRKTAAQAAPAAPAGEGDVERTVLEPYEPRETS